MNELVQLHCSAITANTPRLDDNEINQYLEKLSGWWVSEKEGEPCLEKVFHFKDFNQAVDFTNRVAHMANKENHHPTILTEWGIVAVAWWTHKIKALHLNNFIMAAKTDRSDININRSMPPGKIIPELVYDDLDQAVVWLCQAFGFKERLHFRNHRCQLVLGEASFIAKANPTLTESSNNNRLQPQPNQMDHSVLVRIEDVDQHFEQAVKSGASVISPPKDYPYGERQYSVEDIGGHIWTFSQSIADVDLSEWSGVLSDNPEDAF